MADVSYRLGDFLTGLDSTRLDSTRLDSTRRGCPGVTSIVAWYMMYPTSSSVQACVDCLIPE
eukprot:scaffold216314_cov24-Attheya_sp.AAC.1